MRKRALGDREPDDEREAWPEPEIAPAPPRATGEKYESKVVITGLGMSEVGRRLERNPLRILDSKNPEMQGIIEGAPVMLDYLDAESADHFEELREVLDVAGIAYTLNPRLVRGLDYYNRTVFEWVTDALGSQGAVCSGGRYDGLVSRFMGQPVPATGFSIGVSRLMTALKNLGKLDAVDVPEPVIVCVMDRDIESMGRYQRFVSSLRSAGVRGRLKAQFASVVAGQNVAL